VDFAITSLSPDRAEAGTLRRLKRGHWAIENRLHWRKDLVLGEDASLIHAGQGPRVLSLLRALALNLVRRVGITQIAATMRAYSRHPEHAVARVVLRLTTRASARSLSAAVVNVPLLTRAIWRLGLRSYASASS
jgi:hypothetical protein